MVTDPGDMTPKRLEGECGSDPSIRELVFKKPPE